MRGRLQHIFTGKELDSDVIDEQAVHCFTMGWCWSLAAALQDLTGWDLYGTKHAGWVDHFLVKKPHGDFLDIKGWHTDGELLKETWCDEIEPFTRLDMEVAMRCSTQYQNGEHEEATMWAEAFAPTVLAWYS